MRSTLKKNPFVTNVVLYFVKVREASLDLLTLPNYVKQTS
jgi:hypothetical protein